MIAELLFAQFAIVQKASCRWPLQRQAFRLAQPGDDAVAVRHRHRRRHAMAAERRLRSRWWWRLTEFLEDFGQGGGGLDDVAGGGGVAGAEAQGATGGGAEGVVDQGGTVQAGADFNPKLGI